MPVTDVTTCVCGHVYDNHEGAKCLVFDCDCYIIIDLDCGCE